MARAAIWNEADSDEFEATIKKFEAAQSTEPLLETQIEYVNSFSTLPRSVSDLAQESKGFAQGYGGIYSFLSPSIWKNMRLSCEFATTYSRIKD